MEDTSRVRDGEKKRADKFLKDQDADPPGSASDNSMMKGVKKQLRTSVIQ